MATGRLGSVDCDIGDYLGDVRVFRIAVGVEVVFGDAWWRLSQKTDH